MAQTREGLPEVSPHMSFSTLLYRYFFFGWLFKDVNRGNLLERAARGGTQPRPGTLAAHLHAALGVGAALFFIQPRPGGGIAPARARPVGWSSTCPARWRCPSTP
jgi:hypothetical protein